MIFRLLFFFVISQSTSFAEITIQGLNVIDSQIVLQYFPNNKENINSNTLNNGLKNLYKTGFFSDISIFHNTDTIEIQAKEAPIINKLIFSSDSNVSFDKIKQAIDSKAGRFFKKEVVYQDKYKIQTILHEMGYKTATVEPFLESLDNNKINIVFDIQVGKKIKINNIQFIGNKMLQDTELLTHIKQKPRMLIPRNFSEMEMQTDLINIQKHYKQKGFQDIEVDGILKYHQYTNVVDIEYRIKEGIRYNIGNILIKSSNPNVEKLIRRLLPKMNISKGGFYSSDRIKDASSIILKNLHKAGIQGVNLKHTKTKNNNYIDISFEITDNDIKYIDKIFIKGNKKIHEQSILIELLFNENDILNNQDIEDSENRLKLTGYFTEVEIVKIPKNNNVYDIQINVKESPQIGQLAFMLGYSNFEGIIGSINLQRENLFNSWYSGGFSIMRSGFRETYSVNLNNRHFYAKNIGLGVNISQTRFGSAVSGFSGSKFGNFGYLSNYGAESNAITLNTTFMLRERLYDSVFFTYKDSNTYITGDLAENNKLFAAQYGDYTTHIIGNSITYDKRNNGFMPTAGYLVNLRQSLAFDTLGANQSFFGNEIKFSWHKGLYKDLIFNFGFKGGHIQTYGNNDFLSFDNRYMLGYYNMRGFRMMGLGPFIETVDTNGNKSASLYSIGGSTYYVATLDFTFPISKGENPLYGSVFSDIGTVFGTTGDEEYHYSNGAYDRIFTSYKPRISAGVGLIWYSPMGPFRVDFATAVSKEVYDQTMAIIIRPGNTGF